MKLESLTREVQSSLKKQSPQKIAEFLRLYRQASADLAFAMTHSSNPDVVRMLNEIVGDAHAQIYVMRRRDPLSAFYEYTKVMARSVRDSRGYLGFTFLIGMIATIFGALLVALWPEAARLVLGAEFFGFADTWANREHPAMTSSDGVMSTAFYATNNPIVSLMAGAISVATFGFFGIYVLFMNCIMLGALSQYMLFSGQLGFLYISILPHGVTELSGMFLACSVGLQIAHKFLRPGNQYRLAAAIDAAQRALPILVLSIIMMFIAAPIEGFLSFNGLVPDYVRLLVIVLSAIAWILFFVFHGRTAKSGDETPESADTLQATADGS